MLPVVREFPVDVEPRSPHGPAAGPRKKPCTGIPRPRGHGYRPGGQRGRSCGKLSTNRVSWIPAMLNHVRPDSLPLRRRDFAPEFRWGCADVGLSKARAMPNGADVDMGSLLLIARPRARWFPAAPWPAIVFIAGRRSRPGCIAGRGRLPVFDRVAAHFSQQQRRGEVGFYSRLVDGMLERGIEPWATLYHWDSAGAAGARRLNDAATVAALHRICPCRGRSRQRSRTANRGAPPSSATRHARTGRPQSAHRAGRPSRAALAWRGDSLRANAPRARVGGISLSLHPHATHPHEAAATRRYDGLRNRWFLDPLDGRGYPQDILQLRQADAPVIGANDLDIIATPTDFLGINYYFPETIAHQRGNGCASSTRRVRSAPRGKSRRMAW